MIDLTKIENDLDYVMQNDPEMTRVNELYAWITDALKDAGEHGLQTEVVYSALKLMKSHPDAEIDVAVHEAMVEWDIW
jgi:hypothetical protein